VAAITVEAPWDLDLTEAFFRANGLRPPIIGDDIELRFQALDSNDSAENLTGATIKMTLRKGSTFVTRETGTAIAGATPARDQVAIDADQSAEVGDAGKGWLQVNFAATTAEIALLESVKGKADYELVRKLASGDQKLLAKGQIEILAAVGARPL
jgi:hypothetical protein